MKRSTIRLLRRILPESPARTRVRIRLQTRLSKLFYQGANPLLGSDSEREPETRKVIEDAEVYRVTKCPRIADYYGYA